MPTIRINHVIICMPNTYTGRTSSCSRRNSVTPRRDGVVQESVWDSQGVQYGSRGGDAKVKRAMGAHHAVLERTAIEASDGRFVRGYERGGCFVTYHMYVLYRSNASHSVKQTALWLEVTIDDFLIQSGMSRYCKPECCLPLSFSSDSRIVGVPLA